MENTDDMIAITIYKWMGSAVAVLRWCVHTPSLTTSQWRFLLFWLRLCRTVSPCLCGDLQPYFKILFTARTNASTSDSVPIDIRK
jgi:hypothetical protein